MENITTSLSMCIRLYPCATAYAFGHSSDNVKARDVRKSALCKEHGITLITVPFWWNKKLEIIASIIRRMRPDISVPTSFLHNTTEE